MAATTVVASAYDTSGNGGRKIVRLSNGWLVAAACNTTTNAYYFYKSADNGQTWQQLTYIVVGNSGLNLAMASANNIIYAIITITGAVSTAYSFKFDATTVTNTDKWSTGTTLDSGQSSFGSGCSLAIDGAGTLHAAWCSKNSTYPNSFNIRYAKSLDGGTTWKKGDGTAGVDQLTITNTTGVNNTNPCIVVRSNNYPSIVWQYDDSASGKCIYIKNWNGSSFNAQVYVYNGGSYLQSNPCAAVDSNDNIHVVWYGRDATDTTGDNIRYAKSLDGGTTWKKGDGTAGHDKLTSATGAANSQWAPTITIDKNNNLYIFWWGFDTAVSTSYYQIRKIERKNNAWSSIVTLTNNTTNHAQDAQTLWSKFNMNSDDAVRWVYKDLQAAAVKYDSIALLWSHKLMGVSTPTKIMGVQPSKVMGIQ